ncbi:hypothetical protein F8154_08465 [Alkaliphilus pronyensis]|uniref:O-antigen ligase-related domain-containing protein n=1 Tax=Alkaliphilus pronyensis TaxID=1482732 RepID=A0A6I0F904_9FIRM|nr:O-antigen ligase family protein [Alkaliphilus pronyensis]KAB3534746.1 hypothetical protein F8154_08465 [Alkaliphilus pronyensis]
MGTKSAKKKDINKTTNKNNHKTLQLVLFSLLCVLVFYPPFFRGLFFTGAILGTHIFSLLLFIGFLVYKKLNNEKIVLNSIFDYIGLLLIVAYALPIIFGQWGNLRDAIGELLKYINVFLVYLMIKDFTNDSKSREVVLNVLVISGVLVSLIGLVTAFGYLDLQDAVLGNRIASTFQYPNTLAAFTMTLFFLTVCLIEKSDKAWQKGLYATSGFIMLFTFIFTYSRGAWLLFPIFSLLCILVLPSRARVNTILYFITVTIPIITILQPFTNILNNEEGTARGLIFFAIALGIFFIIYYAIEAVKNRISSTHYKYIYSLIASMALLAIGLVVMAINITQPLVFDNMDISENKTRQIHRSINDINANETYILKYEVEGANSDEKQWPWRVRVFSVNDNNERELISQRIGENNESGEIHQEIETLQDTTGLIIYYTVYYPGTKAVFNQSALYNLEEEKISDIKLSYKYIPESIVSRINAINLTEDSSSARLTFYRDGLKFFKDYPIIGAGGGAWESIYTKYQSEPYYTTEAHNYIIQTMVETGSLGLLLISLLLILLLYMLWRAAVKKNIFNIFIILAILSLYGHSILDFNFSYLSILLTAWVLIGLVNVDSNISSIPKAIRLPVYVFAIPSVALLIFTMSLYSGYRNGQLAVNTINGGNVLEARDYFEKAVKRDPYKETYRSDYANIITSIASKEGNNTLIKEAEVHHLKALKHSPYNVAMYSRLANLYLVTAEFDKAIEAISPVTDIAPLRASSYQEKLKTYMTIGNHYLQSGNNEKAIKNLQSSLDVIDEVKAANKVAAEPITLSDDTMNLINRTKFYLKHHDDIEKLKHFNDIAYINYFDIDTDFNNIPDTWRLWRSSNKEQSIETGNEGVIIDNTKDNRGGIFSNNFTLQPNTDYTVELELDNSSALENARVYVISRTGKYQQHRQDTIEDYTSSFQFTTTADIEAGGQYIIIEHKGVTSEPIIINSIQILQQDYK